MLVDMRICVYVDASCVFNRVCSLLLVRTYNTQSTLTCPPQPTHLPHTSPSHIPLSHPPHIPPPPQNLDKLIHYANLDGRLNVFYSTPDAFLQAKHNYNVPWPVKTDDMFPYADFPHAYWTGYFTTRPASKGFIRAATAYLQVARHAEVSRMPGVGVSGNGGLSGGRDRDGGMEHHVLSSDALEAAVSLTQHHDAITGTEKQHVANDYHRCVCKRGVMRGMVVMMRGMVMRGMVMWGLVMWGLVMWGVGEWRGMGHAVLYVLYGVDGYGWIVQQVDRWCSTTWC